MKFSEHWLREWVNPPIKTAELVTQLTNAGLEVDTVTSVAAAFSNVVVAEIIDVQPHPNADRLRICQVNIGKAEPIIIVTNDTTVKPGMKVPAALVGAHLPELEIKPTALRGVDSFGMFCSAKTLGISDDDSGLLQLAADAPVGKNLRDYLQLDDVIIDIELTPNRGDCLSIAGVAREVGVANHSVVNSPAFKSVPATIKDHISIQINAPEACPRYVSRVIRHINPHAITPIWMQEKLRRGGLRSILPVVDVTNYVMLELGQPMHAFDLKTLGDKIVVEYAGQMGKDVALLNGEKRDITTDTLSIKDSAGNIVAIAGIMGAERGSISAATTDIVLESAFFAPLKVAGKARQYGVHTDSSHRFERGVDPQLQHRAIERATELLLAIVGGQAGPCVEKVFNEYLPMVNPILLRSARIKRILGREVATEKVREILLGLSMQVETVTEGWKVIPPSFRFDITLEIDLIEEIGRVFGYNNIPNHLPIVPTKMVSQSTQQLPLREVRECLKNRGYHEALGYSFVDPKLQTLVDKNHLALPLSNPISSELAVMRTTLWTSLLPILLHNQKRQQTRIRIFETGLRFIEQDGALQQIPTIAGLVWGSVVPEQWSIANREVDFYDVKNDVEILLMGKRAQFTVPEHSALHPGRGAQINIDGKNIGYVGALHPEIEQKIGLNGIYGFELDLAAVLQTQLPKFETVSKFPAIRRDLAMIVAQDIPADDIYHAIANVAGDLLNKLILFDVYQGKGIPEGQRSLAFGLFLQAPDRTLVDAEVNQVISTIINLLQQRFAAVLRE